MPFDNDSIPTFLIFFIPGFISVKVYTMLMPSQKYNFGERLFETLAYSGLNYIVFFISVYLIFGERFFRSNNEFGIILFIVFIAIVAPVLWACLFYRLQKNEGWLKEYVYYPPNSIWEKSFTANKGRFLTVTLKSGTVIAGRSGNKSLGFRMGDNQDIYIQECWTISNKKFVAPVPDSKGVFISGTEIALVEFFDVPF
jgi:hypothetical protein